MFGMGIGELMVLALVGLFVLGPERLPAAIRWAGRAATQVKSYVADAKDQINGPEFDELRKPLAELRKPLAELREPLAELRAADPRRAVREALSGDATTTGRKRP